MPTTRFLLLSTALSAAVPGLGEAYARQLRGAIATFVTTIVLPALVAAAWMWSSAVRPGRATHVLLVATVLVAVSVRLLAIVRAWRAASASEDATGSMSTAGRFAVAAALITVVAPAIVPARGVRTIHVLDDAMAPTLERGDRVWVNSLFTGGSLLERLLSRTVRDVGPSRGDLAVVSCNDGRPPVIRRIVGIVGDGLATASADGSPAVVGAAAPRPKHHVTVPPRSAAITTDGVDRGGSDSVRLVPSSCLTGSPTTVVWSSGPPGIRWHRILRLVR